MDPVEAVFLTLRAKYDGDTGLAGLRDRTQKAHVGLFIDPDDLNKATESGTTIVVDTSAIEEDSTRDVSTTIVSFSGIVTLEVRTPLAGGRVRQRAIVDRLRTLLHNTALSDQGSYKFRPARWLGSGLGGRDGKISVRTCRLFISGNL